MKQEGRWPKNRTPAVCRAWPLQVATRSLARPTRTRFSKHQFRTAATAGRVLCLMRYRGFGPFVKPKVRSARNIANCAKRLQFAKACLITTTLYRFPEAARRRPPSTAGLQKNRAPVFAPRQALGRGVTAGGGWHGALAERAVSTFFSFAAWNSIRAGMTRHRYWLKWLIVADI